MWLGTESCFEGQRGLGWRLEKKQDMQKDLILISLFFLHPGRSSCEDLQFLWNPAQLSLSCFHPFSPVYTFLSVPEHYSASAAFHRWLTQFTYQFPFIASWLSSAYLTSFREQGCKGFNKIQTETLYPLIVSAKNRQQISLLRFTLYKLKHMPVGLSYFPFLYPLCKYRFLSIHVLLVTVWIAKITLLFHWLPFFYLLLHFYFLL